MTNTRLKSLTPPTIRTPTPASLSPYAPELFFTEYQRLSAIHIWLNQVAQIYSTHTQLVTVGTSYEGREILGIRVATRPKNPYKTLKPRKTILITGGAHGREWISVSSVNYLALQLMASYGNDAARTAMVDSFDWVFIPVLNPDGYEYSWTHDRFWRKTRQPTHYASCDGFDLDKAYDYQFDFNTSNNPCSNSFPGQRPWQATEAAQMKQWIQNQTASGTKFAAYIDLHSYSQQILFPYAYSCDSYPPTWENLEELAWGLARAMKLHSHGANYKIGPACEGNVILDTASGRRRRLPRLEGGGGSSLDWFYHEAKVKYAYQIKLPDTGSYGFLLPKEYIVPTGMSVASAMDYLGRFLLGEIGLARSEAAFRTSTRDGPESDDEDDVSNRSKNIYAKPLDIILQIRRLALRHMGL
jgi:extracellular matrix protein 14